MYESCLSKQEEVKKLFDRCTSEDLKYQKIIELGKALPPFPESEKIEANFVNGCQSIMYLHTKMDKGLLYFSANSDALISAGLAAILVRVYSGEMPEVILKCPPDYLESLGIGASLTPNRANGLYSIHLKMKQEALKFLLQQNR
jgi:cysteine desulfuration protein SufE